MTELKLGKIPDRTPVKLTLSLLPELHHSLLEYAAVYKSAYGSEEAVVDLIPFMLMRFLESDRAFASLRRDLK